MKGFVLIAAAGRPHLKSGNLLLAIYKKAAKSNTLHLSCNRTPSFFRIAPFVMYRRDKLRSGQAGSLVPT